MNNTKLFEDKKVRTLWDTEQEKWYISVIDVIAVLTESDRPRKYWSDLKKKLEKEGSELSEKIGQLKMQSSDGKFYKSEILSLFRQFASLVSDEGRISTNVSNKHEISPSSEGNKA